MQQQFHDFFENIWKFINDHRLYILTHRVLLSKAALLLSHIFTIHIDIIIFLGEMTSLTCPEQKCTSQALPTQVKALVSDKNFQLYEKVLLSTTLESMADIVLCPR